MTQSLQFKVLNNLLIDQLSFFRKEKGRKMKFVVYKNFKIGVMLYLVLLLAACASLEDFKEMNSNERADYVCSREKGARKHKSEIKKYQKRVAEINNAISLGYRIQKTCSDINVEKEISTSCTSSSYSNITSLNCSPTTYTEKETICSKIKIPINVSVERENLNVYRDLSERAKTVMDVKYRKYFNDVEEMSAEAAFNFYKR